MKAGGYNSGEEDSDLSESFLKKSQDFSEWMELLSST